MATVSEIWVRVNADVKGLTSGLGTSTVALKTFDATASKTAATTQASASKMQSSFSGLASGFKTLAPAFVAVGALAVAGIVKGIAATTQWASEVRLLQRVTGQSAESASVLVAGAEKLGISVTSLATGLGALSKNIVNGSTGFEKYGISVRDAQGNLLPFDDVLAAVSDRFAQLPKGQEQAAFAMNVFGKSGKDLIPILSQGSAGLAQLADEARKAGLVMSQDDLNAAKELTLAQRGLSEAFRGASISIGKVFIPVATKVVEIGTKAVELFTRIPTPIKTSTIAFTILTGAVAATELVGSFFAKTWGKVIETLGLTAPAGAKATASVVASGVGINGAAAGVDALTNSIDALTKTLGGDVPQAAENTTAAVTEVGAAANGVAAAATTAEVATKALGKGAATAGAEAASASGGFAAAAASASALAAEAGPVALVVAAIAIAVVAATVIIVKNWETIKRAGASAFALIKPIIDEVRSSFTALGPPLQELGKSLGDLGRSIGIALGPVLPILGDIGKALAVMIGLLALGPVLAGLKLVTIGFQALGKVIQLVAFLTEGAANLIIKGVNAIIGQINNVIGASNKWLHTHFDLIPAVQELGAASSDTAASVDGLAGATERAAKANDRAKSSAAPLNAAIQAASPLLDAMSTSYGQVADAAQAAFDQAVSAGGDTTAALQAFADQQIEAAKQARSAFEDQARSALTFSTSMLQTLEQAVTQAQQTLAGDTSNLTTGQLQALRDQAHLTASDILHTFQAATAQTKQFGQNLLEISQRGGKAARDLANSLLQSGDVLAAQVIADSPKKLQDQIVTAFGKSETAADSFSTKLTNAIIGPLKDIRTLLEILIKKQFGIDVRLNDHGARTQVESLRSQLDGLPRSKQIDIIVTRHERHHTGGLVLHSGGMVKRMHSGGRLASDEVPAVLQRGEFVVRRSAVAHVGLGFLERVNQMHDGGVVASPATVALRGSDAIDYDRLEAAFHKAFREELQKQRVEVVVDARRFGRAQDFETIVDGHW
jgi:hypothetical protein